MKLTYHCELKRINLRTCKTDEAAICQVELDIQPLFSAEKGKEDEDEDEEFIIKILF